MAWLGELLSDNSGGPSTTRVITLLWGIGVLLVWSVQCVRLNAIVDVPPGVVAVVGIVMAGKVVQRMGEHHDGQS